MRACGYSSVDNKLGKSLLCRESYGWYCSWGGCLRKFTADTHTHTPRRWLLLDLCCTIMAEIKIASYNNHTSCTKVFSRDRLAIVLHIHIHTHTDTRTHTTALCTEGSLQLTSQFTSCRDLHGIYCKTFTVSHIIAQRKGKETTWSTKTDKVSRCIDETCYLSDCATNNIFALF